MTDLFLGFFTGIIVCLATDGLRAWRRRRKITRWMRQGPLDWR